MIRIEHITSLPDFPWGRESLTELQYDEGAHFALAFLSRAAIAVWEDDVPLFCAGVTKTSFLGSKARLWCLFTNNFQARHIRMIPAFRRLLGQYEKTVITSIHNSPIAKRFARAWGFKPTGLKFTVNGLEVEDYALEV